MQPALRTKVIERLKRDYSFRRTGDDYLREGKCPSCKGKELWINAQHPWVLRCGRLNKCGQEWSIKDLYEDFFNNWSQEHPATEQNPNAAAKAYLADGRGLNTVKLADCFSQELYQDWNTRATSATVRFPIACSYPGYPTDHDGKAGWWERLIDRPQRFGKKKANMPKGWSYRGHVWHNPKLAMDDVLTTKTIWLAEGIFDAQSLSEAFSREGMDAIAISTLSTNNYPFAFLDALKSAAKALDKPLPKLVFAFDVGPAGVNFTRKYVVRAREEGWLAGAAQVRPDGEGHKKDWNDLWIGGELTAGNLDLYVANGDITIAESASEKAYLLWRRSKRADFHFTFSGRTYWARFSAEAINTKITEYAEAGEHSALTAEERLEEAAREVVEVVQIANCLFRTLYFQREETSVADDNHTYYLRIDFPGIQDTVKANFSGAAVTGASEFKKRLASVGPGARFTGSNHQLDKIMEVQGINLRTVDALYFSGYSIDHSAWMFDELAVTAGRVIPINDDDFFEIGKVGVKPAMAQREFKINHDADERDYGWWDDFQLAFGPRGTVTLAYWFMSMFAEQIRSKQQSLPFLELSGDAGTGKSTLLIFLWKLLGRYDGYEGFDPSTATAAAIARQLVKYGNLPTVMLEGDRSAEQNHSRKFDWNELKKLYNGHSPRDRGVANAGVTTFAPRFRGSLVIAQNHSIRDADTPVLERIMALHFDKAGHSQDGKLAARRIEAAEPAAMSGWITHMIRQEQRILEYFWQRFDHHEQRFLADPEVQNGRLALNHAQLAAALDCLHQAMAIGDRKIIGAPALHEGHALITQMVRERHHAIAADHPIIAHFWENFDTLAERFDRGKYYGAEGASPMNLHRDDNLIAIHLPSFESRCADARLSLPAPMVEIKKLLPQSKSRKLLGRTNVNCIDGKVRHCWVFSLNITNQSKGAA